MPLITFHKWKLDVAKVWLVDKSNTHKSSNGMRWRARECWLHSKRDCFSVATWQYWNASADSMWQAHPQNIRPQCQDRIKYYLSQEFLPLSVHRSSKHLGMFRTQLFLSLSCGAGKCYKFSLLTSHLYSCIAKNFKKFKISQVFWLQVRQLINRSFKRLSGKSAFLQPIGLFFSKIAKTVTFVNLQNCHFVLTIPRWQAVMTFFEAIIA